MPAFIFWIFFPVETVSSSDHLARACHFPATPLHSTHTHSELQFIGFHSTELSPVAGSVLYFLNILHSNTPATRICPMSRPERSMPFVWVKFSGSVRRHPPRSNTLCLRFPFSAQPSSRVPHSKHSLSVIKVWGFPRSGKMNIFLCGLGRISELQIAFWMSACQVPKRCVKYFKQEPSKKSVYFAKLNYKLYIKY